MRNNDIDIGLDILCRHQKGGQTLSHAAIAEVCGCSANSIDSIEKRALKKLRPIMVRAHLTDFLDSNEA